MKFLSKVAWNSRAGGRHLLFEAAQEAMATKKKQSKTKKKEMLSDLICLPNSGSLFTDPLFSLQSPSRVRDKKKNGGYIDHQRKRVGVGKKKKKKQHLCTG